MGSALGGALAGEAGAGLGGRIGQHIGGRLGEAASNAAENASSSGSNASAVVGQRRCSVVLMYEEGFQKRCNTSARAIYLSKKQKWTIGAELAPGEERIFWREFAEAKRLELESWAEHGPFAFKHRASQTVRAVDGLLRGGVRW